MFTRMMEKKRLLTISACLLLAFFCVALAFKSVFNSSAWFIADAFLLPALASGLAAAHLDRIRSSPAVYVVLALSILLSISSVLFAVALEASHVVMALISCVHIGWVGVFQLGMDSGDPMLFPNFYSGMAIFYITELVKRDSVMWASAYAVPYFLVLKLRFYTRYVGGEEEAVRV